MDKKFEQLKQDVWQSFSEDDLYKTSILKTPKIYETSLYKFCEAMPKGADLHAHGGAMTPVRHLIDFVVSTLCFFSSALHILRISFIALSDGLILI